VLEKRREEKREKMLERTVERSRATTATREFGG